MNIFGGFATMREFDAASRIYVDSNIFIYHIEQTPNFVEAANRVFEDIAASGARLLASELTVAECLYKPSKDKDIELVNIYEKLFAPATGIDLIPITGATVKLAALRGGELGLKLLDAVHYVTALEEGCDVFVTSDNGFRSGPKMRVLRIS